MLPGEIAVLTVERGLVTVASFFFVAWCVDVMSWSGDIPLSCLFICRVFIKWGVVVSLYKCTLFLYMSTRAARWGGRCLYGGTSEGSFVHVAECVRSGVVGTGKGVLVVSSGRSILFTLGLLLSPCIRGVGIAARPAHVRRFVAAFRPSIVLLSVGFHQSTVDKRRKFSYLRRVLGLSPRTVILFVATCTSASGTMQTVGTKTVSFVPGP